MNIVKKMSNLTEKELTVIDRIGDNGGKITQRQIAQHAGFSLGLTNVILKRLAKKGHIKVRQLTPKKMQYILTSKGMVEKTKKSYQYIFRTINEIKNIKKLVAELLITEYRNGNRRFGIIGDSEILDIVEITARGIPSIIVERIGNEGLLSADRGMDIFINCYTDMIGPKRNCSIMQSKTIRLMDYIIEKGGNYGRETDISA